MMDFGGIERILILSLMFAVVMACPLLQQSTPTSTPTVTPTPAFDPDAMYWIPFPESYEFEAILGEIGQRRGPFMYFEGVAIPEGKPICIRVQVPDGSEWFDCFAVMEGIWVYIGSVPINGGEGQSDREVRAY